MRDSRPHLTGVKAIGALSAEALETLPSRLKQAAARVGNKQTLAHLAGIDYRTLHRYETRQSVPPLDVSIRLAEAAKVSPLWLLCGIGDVEASDEVQRAGARQLPGKYVLMASAFAGRGSVRESQAATEALAFSAEWLEKIAGPRDRDNMRLIEAPDDSLAPWISEGDLLAIDTSVTEVSRDGIYALRQRGGSILVRRLQALADGGVNVLFDNPLYKPFTITASEASAQLPVAGRVFWRGGRV